MGFFESIFQFIKDYLSTMGYAEKFSLIGIIAAALIIITLEKLFPYTKGKGVP